MVTLSLTPEADTGTLSEHQLMQCLSLMLSAAEVEGASPFSSQSWQVSGASHARPSSSRTTVTDTEAATAGVASRYVMPTDRGASAPLMSSASLKAELSNSGARE